MYRIFISDIMALVFVRLFLDIEDDALIQSMFLKHHFKTMSKLHHGILTHITHITQYHPVNVMPPENGSELSTLTGQCVEKSK